MSRQGKKLPFKVEGKPVVAEVLEFESSDSTSQVPAGRQPRRGVAAVRDNDLPKTPAFLKKTVSQQIPQEAPTQAPPKALTQEQTSVAIATNVLDAPLKSVQGASKKRKSIEVEEAVPDEPSDDRSSKRKSRTEDRAVAEVATAAKGVAKTPEKIQSETKKKAHYPIIPFMSNLSREGRTHAELLGLVSHEVCDNEIRGLESYFNKSFPDMSHRDIFLHLKAFLEDLPLRVEEACPGDAKFKPELRRSERAAARTFAGGSKAEMEALRAQKEELQKYASDISAFLDSLGVGKTNRTPASKGGKRPGSKNDLKAIDGLVSEFTSNLDGMETMLDSLLQGLDHAAVVSRKAREAQQKLFDSHQKIRFESVVSGGVRMDTSSARTTRVAQAAQAMNAKDLVKVMQK